ncbi:energy transducer TonB [Rhodocyclaceae bacterium]
MKRDHHLHEPGRSVGLLCVLALHAAVLWGLWQHRLLPVPGDVATLFVNFIAPPVTELKAAPKPQPPKPTPIEKPRPRQIVAETPAVTQADYIAPLPPPEPSPEPVIEAPPLPLPVGPVALSAELSVACPERASPTYPAQSRRLGEEGTVILRVELDESGRVANARVNQSSGHARLDAAALTIVRTWRCMPTLRSNQPVRAVALQPFKFVLQGN